jgi:hypothetical protein
VSKSRAHTSTTTLYLATMPTTMGFPSILHTATTAVDGGARSFPATHDDSVPQYQAPTTAYQKVFFIQASRPSQSTPDYSAGWLVPDDCLPCNPVFVAHSLLCAIALVRDTLPPGSLPDDAWAQLVSAAVTLSKDADIPPSAQSPAAIRNATAHSSLSQTVPNRRTLSPDASSASSKRRRLQSSTPAPTTPGNDVDHSPAPTAASEPPSPAAPQEYVVNVSNNNRRAERERTKKQAAATAKRRFDCGLLEPAESASAEEKIAYQNIRPKDNAHIAWIIKQPANTDSDFYQKTKSPYATACSMLAKARAVGTPSTWQNVAAFLEAWRENGSPVSERSTAVVPSQAIRLRPSGRVNAFHRAWHMSCVAKARLSTAIIEYRWAMAFLGREYHAKIHDLADDRRHAKTQVIDHMWGEIEPNSTEQHRKCFVRRLTQATRWYEIADTLGWGSLCLLPDSVSNKWVKSFPAHAWLPWLELIKRVNPEACTASRALDAWIGQEGIQGGPIQGQKKLYIEEKGSASHVEEVVDSTDEESSDIESSAEPAKSTARRLRQLTLLELFKPQ